VAGQNFLANHILESVCAAAAEADGNEDLANSLRAQLRLRLLTMSDEEIWELARLISSPPAVPSEWAYGQIEEAIKDHSATANQWLKNLYTKD